MFKLFLNLTVVAFVDYCTNLPAKLNSKEAYADEFKVPL